MLEKKTFIPVVVSFFLFSSRKEEFKEVGRLNSSAFNGLVIASHCQATDLMIRELRQQQTLSMMPILRIDFFRCHQQQNSAITENELLFVQRLELYLLNVFNYLYCN